MATARYTASFLGLFVPNSLTARHPSVGSSGFRGASFLGDLRGTATSAPSVSQLVSSGSLTCCSSVLILDILDSCALHSLCLSYTQIHTSGGANSWSGQGSPYPALLTPSLLALWRGSTPPQGPILRCPRPGRRPGR
jgi:hypothetical protein